MQPLKEFIIQEIPPQSSARPLVAAHPDQSITEVLEILSKNNILSLPLQSRTFPGKFTAIVSLFDVLSFLVNKCHGDSPVNGTATESFISHQKISEILAKDLFSQPIEYTITLNEEDESYRIWEVDYRDKIDSTINIFTLKGVHRALVTDALNQIPSRIMTQTDVVKFIQRNLSQIQFNFVPSTATVQELNLMDRIQKTPGSIPPSIAHIVSDSSTVAPHFKSVALVCMADHETALEGYVKMRRHKVLALPIVNNNGVLVGSLSTSELRGLTSSNLERLALPVLEFLKTAPKASHALRHDEFVSCTSTSTFKQVIDKLVSNGLHRVWIVDGENKPIGVVTLSDVIAKTAGLTRN